MHQEAFTCLCGVVHFVVLSMAKQSFSRSLHHRTVSLQMTLRCSTLHVRFHCGSANTLLFGESVVCHWR